MKSGYDQFFSKARKAAQSGSNQQKSQRKVVARKSEISEQQMMAKLGLKYRPKRKFPFAAIFICILGLGGSLAGMQYRVQIENFVKNVELTFMTGAFAEEAPAAAADKAKTKDEKTEAKADGKSADGKAAEEKVADNKEAKALSADEVDHLRKLNDRKAELDAKEEELTRMESELQAQKAALEKRMSELDDTRRKISSVLDDRVKADDQKVESLVQLYSNMRPPQAAKVFETLDEDLTVEILSRMKKKNAADIMNLLKAEKAQVLSEKLAGYKRSK